MSVKGSVVPVVLLLVGCSLLLNPVYYAPNNVDGEASEITYEIAPVETEAEARQALIESNAVLQCETSIERPCALEREVVAQGQLEAEIDGPIPDEGSERYDPYRHGTRYEIVELEDGFHLPETTETTNGTALTLREVSPTAALEYVAVSSEATDDDVREAVETGSVSLTGERIPEFERGQPIAHEGEIYALDGVRYDGTVVYDILATRGVLFLSGVLPIGVAWLRRGD